MTSARRPLALLTLLRISLAPTVVADLAGGVGLARGLPGGIDVVLRMTPAALFLFCGGMALNARVDLEEDRATRPRRPLPSGAVAPGVATLLALLGLVCGPLFAWLLGGRASALWATGMAGAIVLYHTPLKRIAIVGPLLLGAIRGADLMLGAVACVGIERALALALAPAAMYAAYVVGASFIAHEEDRAQRTTLVRSGATIALAAIVANAGLALRGPSPAEGIAPGTVAAVAAAWHLYSLKGARVLFRPTGWGTMSLAAFAGLFLSRMPFMPAVAALGAGCGDLGLVAIVMFLLVRFLVRFVPPS